MGEVQIPADKIYDASTQRAVNNFPVSGRPMPRRFIEALGLIKWAAAEANLQLKKLDSKLAKAIGKESLEVAQGKYDEHFSVDTFQTGSGTSTNMNANEVIANLVNLSMGGSLGSKKPVHPNDHVNMGQSSNDTIPTAFHVSALLGTHESLLPQLKRLAKTLDKKSKEFASVIKIGRTHLQDATPMTMGQVFSGFTTQIKKGIERIEFAAKGLQELAIGGTAVGTGINTHPQFAKLVCEKLSQKTKIKFREADNHFEAQAAKDAIVFFSGALKTVAVSLFKIANDIRWLASGPRCGIGELTIPALQPGSSIMPGKVNPVMPEMICQVAIQVIGNDVSVTLGGQNGNFELNVMMPMMISNLLESVDILSNSIKLFNENCVMGLDVNKERTEALVEQSLAMVTSLVPVIGYDKSAAIAKESFKTGKTIRELLTSKKILSNDEIKKYLDPKTMIKPHS